MPVHRIKHLETSYGDLHQVIPELVNQYGQHEAARKLGISSATVNRWLKTNGYKPKRMRLVKYIRESQEGSAA
ncbi:MAG TPA: helix-turn-helix domain-containing protein [Aggregatilineales bacterium]|nr:helix-turn-helix domain-containing protein [Aggregatilineales bacterium]